MALPSLSVVISLAIAFNMRSRFPVAWAGGSNTEGVEKLEIKVDEGIAKITVKKGKSLAINGVKKAVKDGGFTPREISITVTGKLNEQNEQTVLTIPDSRQFFFLVPNEQLSKVEEMLDGKDRTLKLTGKVEKRKVEKSENSSHILTIKHFEVL